MGNRESSCRKHDENRNCNLETTKAVMNCSDKNHQLMLKLVGKSIMKMEYMHSFKASSHRYLLIKGKHCTNNFTFKTGQTPS